MKTILCLAVALGLCASGANAAEEVGQVYITPMATYIDPDATVGGDGLDDGFQGGQLAIGYALAEHWDAEFAFLSLGIDAENTSGDMDQTGFAVNLLNVYNRAGRFSPYLIGGIGVLSNDPSVGSGDESMQVQGGAGLFTDLWGDRVALRTEALYRWAETNADDDVGDVLVNIGLQFALGGKEEPAPVAAAAPPPSPPPDTDSDRDGVVDRLDRCPGTPMGTPVDSVGCPLDSDGDGVANNTDQCPDTPKGDRVGAQGCSCDVVRQVQFAHDSAELTAEGKAQLDEMAENLVRLKFVAGTVVGHTDSTGAEAYNQQLSERRAQTVADYLQAKGIAIGRLRVSGAGESEPIADNKTAEGRAQNRRVVLKRTDCDAPR